MKNIVAKLILLIGLTLSVYSAHAQDREDKKTQIYIYPSTASYPGGEASMMKFISDNLKYPNIEACVQGKVVIRFMIGAEGTIDSIKVLRSLHPNFDKEAMRVVGLMPRWKPAKLGDQPVDSWYTLPIIFRLNEEQEQPTDTVILDSIYVAPDVLPEYPDGLSAMILFINENLRHPVTNQCEYDIQGRVTIRFVVTKTGDIEQIKVVRGIAPYADKDAIRVVEQMPKWIPAKHKGEVVNSYYTLPVLFRHH